MKLINRYVSEVGRKLPLLKGRADIEKELRSTLEDMLEDRAQKLGRPVDEEMEIGLLKEYGSPQKVAETYNPQPYLIGPRMFPFFLFILKIVLAAVALGLGIATVIKIVNLFPMSAWDVFKAIGQGLLSIFSAWIGAFGNLALIFALIERLAPSSDDFKVNEEEWDPASLKKEPEPDDVKIWEPITSIVFIFIALSILNFNPQIIGIYYLDGSEWHSFAVLSEAFFRWLPLMNIAWVAEIILNGMLIRSGKWNTTTRLFSMGIKVFQIVILALLISGPAILAFTPEMLAQGGIDDPEAIKILTLLASRGMDFILGIAIFGSAVEIIKTGYKMVTQGKEA